MSCPGEWSTVDVYVPGLNPKAICTLCGKHWSNHDHETPIKSYTVTSKAGAWIKSYSGGPAGWSLHEAKKQAKDQNHPRVEVRTYVGGDYSWSREYSTIYV